MAEILSGCVSANLTEIDGKEFSVRNLKELIAILKKHKEVHLNYFVDEAEDVDMWLRMV